MKRTANNGSFQDNTGETPVQGISLPRTIRNTIGYEQRKKNCGNNARTNDSRWLHDREPRKPRA